MKRRCVWPIGTDATLRIRDEFLASMSHELRTPLAAILSLSEGLSDEVAGPLNERQRKYVATITESGQHLLALINDVLDLSKIEAGRLELECEPLDVDLVCHASLRLVKQQAQRKGLTGSLRIDETIHSMVADERRLKQILVNLLSNAVKFTPEGGAYGIDVRADLLTRTVSFCVWDTGIGIDPAYLPFLFQPFVQVDSQLACKQGGTGLGLGAGAAHGGTAWRLGRGEEYAGQRHPFRRYPALGSELAKKAATWRMAPSAACCCRNPRPRRMVSIQATVLAHSTIFLLEDNESAALAVQDYLASRGCTVLKGQRHGRVADRAGGAAGPNPHGRPNAGHGWHRNHAASARIPPYEIGRHYCVDSAGNARRSRTLPGARWLACDAGSVPPAGAEERAASRHHPGSRNPNRQGCEPATAAQ